MKILCCFGQGEPEFSSARGIVHGLKMQGHDVLTCGPSYWGRGGDADISLPDKPFPETYEYEEVLEQVSGRVDLVLQLEPHFFLVGPKPLEIVSAYYFTDPHRGGVMWYKMAILGKFDHIFVGQKYFLPLFEDLPIRVHSLPVGFDERRFSPSVIGSQVTQISFVGQTGLANMEYPFEDDCGRYATTTPNLPVPDRYAFGFPHPGFDYAERGEVLYRLCRDFKVRIYESVWETPYYMQAIQKGAIGFNRSLLNDIGIRCFETLAAGRILVCDEVPYLDELLVDGKHCATYRTYYRPFFENYSLEYHKVYHLIKYYLDHDKEREAIAKQGQEHVWANHTWRCRAQELLGIVFG